MSDIICVLSGRFTEPTAGNECYEVIWSNGHSCHKCPNIKCYRNGWGKKLVDADNKKLQKDVAKQ
jgi:hypothetical protein